MRNTSPYDTTITYLGLAFELPSLQLKLLDCGTDCFSHILSWNTASRLVLSLIILSSSFSACSEGLAYGINHAILSSRTLPAATALS